MVPASTATGLLVGSLLATFMFTVWGADSAFVVDWGWRIPFWLALPLGYITHYIRTHLEDSPVYAQMQERMKEMGGERWSIPFARCSPSISGCCSSRSVPAC